MKPWDLLDYLDKVIPPGAYCDGCLYYEWDNYMNQPEKGYCDLFKQEISWQSPKKLDECAKSKATFSKV